jgi:hypothetical protein
LARVRALRFLLSAVAVAAAPLALAPPDVSAATKRVQYDLVAADARMTLNATQSAEGYAGTAGAHVRSRKRLKARLTLGAKLVRLRARPVSFSSRSRGRHTLPDGTVRHCAGRLAGRFDALNLTVRPKGRRVEVVWGLGSPVQLCPWSTAMAFPLLLYPPAAFNVVTYPRSAFKGKRVVLPIALAANWTNASNGLAVSLAWTGQAVFKKVPARADRGEPAPRPPRGS